MKISKILLAIVVILQLQTVAKATVNNNNKLWYTQPAEKWMLQALPIGNGSIGAMIFGGIGKEHLQFNEKSLWSGKQLDISNPKYQQNMTLVKELLAKGKVPEADVLLKEAGGFSREHFGSFQPFGDVFMEFEQDDNATDYHRELDLSRALVSVSYRIDGVKYRREYFASFPDQVVVMRITADRPARITMRISMTTPHEQAKVVTGNNLDLILNGRMPENGIRYCSRLKVQPDGGTTTTNANGIEVRAANSVVLLLSAKTNYSMNWPTCQNDIDPGKVTLSQIEKASKKSFPKLLKTHLTDYSTLFNRVQLALESPADRSSLPTDQALIAYTNANREKAPDGGDPGLEALLFHYGRYLMISSSRKGALPANLQGLWNDSKTPAWESDYHTDINLEMNYWINGPANLSECFSPFSEYVDFLRSPGRKTARNYFGANGFFVNIYTNPWGYAEPRWPWVGAGGWLCQNLYDHFLFTGNLDYLRKDAYPIMKEACLFYLDMLIPYVDNSLVVVPGVSPEINFRFEDGKFYRVSAGASIDQQIVHDLFTNTIEAAQILKKDTELISTLTNCLSKLSPPLKVGQDGSIQEWVEDWKQEDIQHRHISHLYALYPGRLIDPLNTPQWVGAAEKSLSLRGDNQTGWGTAWRIACYARLGQGEKAYAFFKSLIRHCTATNIVYRNGGGAYENLLTCHSPFQIDGNFGFSAAVAEMLLQSYIGDWEQGYEIHLLPAIPKAWSTGTVKGLVARGGFTVDMEWKAGKLVKAVILSNQGKNTKICYNGKIIELKTGKGKAVTLDSELNIEN
ncbi:MAG: alpha-L-fucosidase [Bacteroidetes bacterium]|nr:alpha-L-fucosidase [Bacteroidota bacterium]